MNRIKGALTRKFGPAPAWAWLLTFAGVIYFYRRFRKNGMVSGTGTGSVAPAPATPQPITTLQPGESAYDPNLGRLTTAPGGSVNGSADFPQALEDLASAIQAGQTMGSQSGGSDAGTDGSSKGSVGNTTPAVTNTSNHDKTRNKFNKNHHQTKRHNKRYYGKKSKPNKGLDTLVLPPGSYRAKRSPASLRNHVGGRAVGLTRGKHTLHRAANAPVKRETAAKPSGRLRLRHTLTTPLVTTVVRQRPLTGFRPSNQARPLPAPRPSVAQPASRSVSHRRAAVTNRTAPVVAASLSSPQIGAPQQVSIVPPQYPAVAHHAVPAPVHHAVHHAVSRRRT